MSNLPLGIQQQNYLGYISQPAGYSGGTNGAGGFLGFEGAPAASYYGGNPYAASAATTYFTGEANQTAGNATPTIDMTGANKAQQGLYGSAIPDQQAAFNTIQQTANGGGPAQAAAKLQEQSGVEDSINSNLALANSARGSAGLANAQKNAIMGNTQTTQNAIGQAAQTQAQMSAAAQGQLAGAGQDLASSYLGEEGQASNEAQAQSALQEQQNQLNQQGALAYQSLGAQAQTSALGASEYNQGIQAGVNENNANAGAQLFGTGLATAGMIAAAAADVHLKEPGGDAHWSLREEPDFILARNERTGELRKVATEPLDKSERSEAVDRPHGAGPLGSMASPRTQTVSDMRLGAPAPATSTTLGPRGRVFADMDIGDPQGIADVDPSEGGALGMPTEALDARQMQMANVPSMTPAGSDGGGTLGGDIGGAGYGGGDMATLEGPGTNPNTGGIASVDPTMGGTLGTQQAGQQFGKLDKAAGNTAANTAAAKNKPGLDPASVGALLKRTQIKSPSIQSGQQMAANVARYGG